MPCVTLGIFSSETFKLSLLFDSSSCGEGAEPCVLLKWWQKTQNNPWKPATLARLGMESWFFVVFFLNFFACIFLNWRGDFYFYWDYPPTDPWTWGDIPTLNGSAPFNVFTLDRCQLWDKKKGKADWVQNLVLLGHGESFFEQVFWVLRPYVTESHHLLLHLKELVFRHVGNTNVIKMF